MAKVGYGPKDFDSSDYQAAVRRVVDFLDEHVSAFEDLDADVQLYPNETWQRLVPVLSGVVDAAYQVAERSSPEFPVLLFMDKVVLRLEEMHKAIAKIAASHDGDGFEFIDAERRGKWELHKLARQLQADYPEFRSRLKLLARRTPPPEAAPESERPATGPAPTVEAESLKGLSESEKRVAEEMMMALDFLRQQSETEEHEFECPTYEVMYRAVEELLADKGEKPSQTPETWRRYASKVRRHLDMPGRKRRA